MDGLNLLQQAQNVGLSVTSRGGFLVIKGPKSASLVAKELLSCKKAVLDALGDVSNGAPGTIQPSGVTTTRQTAIPLDQQDQPGTPQTPHPPPRRSSPVTTTPWPRARQGEPHVLGLPIRKCSRCGRQLVWIRPENFPNCIICGLEGLLAEKGVPMPP